MRISDWSSDVGSSDLVGGGDDIIVGDALATGAVDAGGLGGTATANNKAGVTGSSDAYVWAEAGSDFIDGGEGNNLLVGDAATTDENGGNATANNEASVDGAEGSAGAGNDDIEWDADNVFFGPGNLVAGEVFTAADGTTDRKSTRLNSSH